MKIEQTKLGKWKEMQSARLMLFFSNMITDKQNEQIIEKLKKFAIKNKLSV
jgi:hypothetical protein